jgi:hypothetical protein
MGGKKRTTLEPQQAHDTAEPNVLLEHVRDAHAGVEQLLSSLVTDGRDERSGLADEAEFLARQVSIKYDDT